MNPRVPCESQGPVVVSTPGQLGSQICLTANAGGDRYFQQTLRLVPDQLLSPHLHSLFLSPGASQTALSLPNIYIPSYL